MDSTTSFCRRDSLNAVPTGLTFEKLKVFSIYLQLDREETGRGGSAFDRSSDSAEVVGHPDVGFGELFHEELGVVSAFGGIDLDVLLHFVFLRSLVGRQGFDPCLRCPSGT